MYANTLHDAVVVAKYDDFTARRAVMGCSTTLDGRLVTAVSAVEADRDTPRLVARTRTGCRFVEATNCSAAIGSVDDAAEILRREAGTTVVQA
jgi:hypothetical protein